MKTQGHVTIIPLSLDGSIPQGFIGHIQSTKVDPGSIALADLLPGLAKRDVSFVIDLIINLLRRSGGFRAAEADFELILPFVGKASNDQVAMLLTVAAENSQVLHATKVARTYLPPIIAEHGHLLTDDLRTKIDEVLARYAQ